MEADDAVGYLWIGRELANRGRVLFRLLKQDSRGLACFVARLIRFASAEVRAWRFRRRPALR
jgi:hypothetical protein